MSPLSLTHIVPQYRRMSSQSSGVNGISQLPEIALAATGTLIFGSSLPCGQMLPR